MKGNITKVW